jgi:hypothetical protein
VSVVNFLAKYQIIEESNKFIFTVKILKQMLCDVGDRMEKEQHEFAQKENQHRITVMELKTNMNMSILAYEAAEEYNLFKTIAEKFISNQSPELVREWNRVFAAADYKRISRKAL